MKATLTSKGQVTIPKSVRQKLNLREGDMVSFEENGAGKWVFAKASVGGEKSAMGVANQFRSKTTSVSVEDMNAAIAAEAKASYGRSGK